MIDLAQRSEPYEIALPYGLSVTVKPLTTAGMAAVQSAARRAVEAIERQARERTEAGLELDGLPDFSAEGERDGFYQAQLIRELAVRHITTWTGVDREGRTGASDTREHRCGDGALPGRRAVLPGVLPPPSAAERGKKRMWALCRWHFQPGGGPESAGPAATTACPAPEACPEQTAALPLSRACLDQPSGARGLGRAARLQSQLRLAPSGHVVGIDMDVPLSLASARGCDLAVLSELLPAAEAGLVEALSIDRGRG